MPLHSEASGKTLRTNLVSVLMMLLMLVSAWVLGARPAEAASVPSGFADNQLAQGFRSPTSLTVLPDGRVLVVEQDGEIRMVKQDRLLTTPFYTVPNVDAYAERGCLGITYDPNFTANRHVYVFCTVRRGSASHNRILRLTESNDVGGSAQVILDLPDVPEGVQWHMGGGLRFGVDGKLYVAVGGHEDLRVSPPESSFSQNLSVPFGKILRINPDGSFPSDNPYFNTPGAYRGNFNLGLRNPFAIDIQPGSGLMYINDVGAGSFEEINRGLAGANYGWPFYEGSTDDSRFTNAAYQYGRELGCAITGGAFYNPVSAQFPSNYHGKYLFADFCQGWIRVLDPANPAAGSTEFAGGIGNPTALAVAPDGSLYYIARNQGTGPGNSAPGTLGKISYTNSQLPRITQQPQSRTVYIGSSVTFSVSADSASGYQWQRNGVDIPGATSPQYTLESTHASDDQARFRVLVRNAHGTIASQEAVLTVSTNRPPVASIGSPAEGQRFSPGDEVVFSGTGTDAEDGSLPASAFTWQVDFMHDTHAHPLMPASSGITEGSFTVSTSEAEAANVWLRLSLTVQDSAGQNHTVTRNIYPRNQLSGMIPARTPVNGRGPIEINRNNGDAAAGDGGTLALDQIPYPRGIGVYAPSEIVYDLGGQCSGNLIADVGVDDVAGDQGSVIFQVLLDGAKIFDSGVVRGSDLRQSVNVSIAGGRSLQLVVTDAGDGNAMDYANWGGARVTGCVLPDTDNERGSPLTPPVGGGGGGCVIGGGNRFDPLFPAMLAVSVGWLLWRRRARRNRKAE